MLLEKMFFVYIDQLLPIHFLTAVKTGLKVLEYLFSLFYFSIFFFLT